MEGGGLGGGDYVGTQFKLNHLSYLEDHGPVGAIGRDSLNLNWCT